MWLTIGKFLIGSFPSLVDSVGGQIIRYHDTTAKMQADQNVSGSQLAAQWLGNVTETNRIKAEARAAEGTWGPTGLLAFSCGALFVIHQGGVVFDSMSLFGHVVGSWRISRLPGLFETTQHMVLQSLFYVGGGVAGLSILAKAFRR